MIGTVRVCLFVYNGNFHMNIQCFKMHTIGTVRVCLFVYNSNFHMNIQCFKLGITLVR